MDPHESSPGPGEEERHDGRSGDPIMSNLPRSRPRRTATVRRPPPSPPPQKPPPASAAPTRPATVEGAPGLPRLALEGAIEAAKLPVKVGANITFRALDAVADALRRR